jgi:hypothetical protein
VRPGNRTEDGGDVAARVATVVVDGLSLDAGQVVDVMGDPVPGRGADRPRAPLDGSQLECPLSTQTVDEVLELHGSAVVVER